MLSPQWLDQLRNAITLSSLIGRTVKLQRAGHEYKACCPFHDEKTPSFYVNDQKGFYHCFGCEAHGDAIRWLTDQQGLPFMDAVKELAAMAGMDVPAPDPRAAKRQEEAKGLRDLMEAAQTWFSDNLSGPQGAEARAYLERRGIAEKTIRAFGFGYAPEDRTALGKALTDYPKDMLVEGGLRIEVEGKEPYDRFRGRLMLPIRDPRGRVIAFGGRILKDIEGAPKYLNSPDTPLFDKGRNLYNFDRSGPLARKSGRMLVVEGYMDAIACAAAGIEEVVAPLGTALTEAQLGLLWRVVDVPVLCFDGDGAGQRAAMRAVSRALPLLAPGKSLAIAVLPTGKDPDDLLKERGREAMLRVIEDARPLTDVLWGHESQAQPLRTPEDKAGLKARVMEHVDAIGDPDIRALYKRELMDRFSTFAFPKREFGGRRQWSDRPAPASRPSSSNASRLSAASAGGLREKLATAVLVGLERYPGEIPRHADAIAGLDFSTEEQRAAATKILERAALDTPDEKPTWDSPDNLPPAQQRKAGLPLSFLAANADPEDAVRDLAEAVALLVERPALDVALADAAARFETDPEGAFADQQRLLNRKLEFEERLRQLSSARAMEPDKRGTDKADSGDEI
ncbi:DNA primase [Pseudoblastomonas halimionae]|uniref:DNA primase n=1 Tax=Alteriqipengyuania halimionae TaxID=1926630 RepID=A0A6I4U0G4_9SPHN|nr:DNA primase [Alteriqipengyuania halimionae]MXP09266.1 DNA primase [Alteriqipengyuania halimionae]